MIALPRTLGVVDGNQVMPFVLLGGLWLVVLWQVVRGLRTGRMTEFRRDSAAAERSVLEVDSRRTPFQFRLLHGFYLFVLVLIPVLLIVAMSR